MSQTAGIGVVDRRAVVPRTFAWSGEPQGRSTALVRGRACARSCSTRATPRSSTPGPDVAVVLHFVDPDAAQALPAQERAHVRGRARRARRAARRHAPHRLPAARARAREPVRDGEPDRATARSPQFVTLEQGTYAIDTGADDDQYFFKSVFSRVEPLASSRLVIGNEFTDRPARRAARRRRHHRARSRAPGERLAALDLLPAAFPIEEILSDRDLRHVKLLYGIGGLSYGNVSARRLDVGARRVRRPQYWMSASGVDKSALHEVGRDILLVTGYDADARRHAAARARRASSRVGCRSTRSSTG